MSDQSGPPHQPPSGQPPNQPPNQPPRTRQFPGPQPPDPTRVQPAWNQPDWQQSNRQQQRPAPGQPASQQPGPPNWQQPGPPSWQQPAPGPPSWQQPGPPSWQQPVPGPPSWQQQGQPFRPTTTRKSGPLIAVGLLVAVVVAAVVTIVVINNGKTQGPGSAFPDPGGSNSVMTGRTIGARSLPESVSVSSSPASSVQSTSSSADQSTSDGGESTGGQPVETTPRSPTVSPRPSGSGTEPTGQGQGQNPSGGVAVGDCVSIAEFDTEPGEGAGVSLTPLDCDNQDATYLVQADGYQPCDDYELSLNSPQDKDRALCLDFNVEEGDCLTVGEQGPLGDRVQNCADVQPAGSTYLVLSVKDRTSDIADCPSDTEVALPNVTRDRLVCLGAT